MARLSKSNRIVIVVTAIATFPSLILLGLGFLDWLKPPDYSVNPDHELNILLPLWLVFLSALSVFFLASLAAAVYDSVKQR